MLPDYAELESAVGHDWYALDPNLSFLLDYHLPDPALRREAEVHVSRFGALVGKVIAPRADETDKHGPVLNRYDRWGYDVGEVQHHPTWLANKADLVRNGFVSLEAYAGHPVPDVASAAVGYLVSQAETAAYCALGMTGGAIDIVDRHAPRQVRDEIVTRLSSLDPETSWESGMFLTERQGGSDVGANTTRAVLVGGEWRITGEKHFCSDVDADMFLVLARPEGAPDGIRGLALFLMPRRRPDGSSNGFVIRRLKPKLGTIGVPTAEVAIDNAFAWLAGGDVAPGSGAAPDASHDGRGIKRMMEMVNLSRFGVGLMGLGIHRRSFLEAAIYAAQREQFGSRIDAYPMVRETLVDLLVDLEAGLAGAFEVAGAFRRTDVPDSERNVWRIMVPLVKMRATRVAIHAASTALEIFGGNGYMEDWPMARQLRDAQANTVWEGTENIIALDVLRSMRTAQAHEALLERVEQALEAAVEEKVLSDAVDTVASSVADVRTAIAYMGGADLDTVMLQARRFGDLLADTSEGALLLEHAAFSLRRDGDARKAAIAHRFARERLATRPVRGITSPDRLALDLFEPIVRYGRIEPGDLANAVSTI